MKIDKNTRQAILKKAQENPFITVSEIVDMLEAHCQAPDTASLVDAEMKRAARRLLATLRDDKNERTHFALGDKKGVYVCIDTCGLLEMTSDAGDRLEPLSSVENQLKVKRNGLNKSLRKVSQIKKALGLCVDMKGAHSEETAALAEKLYSMADELQALLAV